MDPEHDRPRGVRVAALFFLGGGLLEIACAVLETRPSPSFWPVWEALGRAILHFVVAAMLYQRLFLGRSIAMVYCLAMVPTYLAALLLAWSGAPLEYPASVVVQSLYQVPSCLLLFPYLRSPEAALVFTRSFLGR